MTTPRSTHDRTRFAARVLIGTTSAALLTVGLAGAASAVPVSDGDSTQANVHVDSAIALTGLTDGFDLTGIPGSTHSQDGDVSFTVTTNSIAGYGVTVQSTTASMLPVTAGNTDSIPIGKLSVRETGTTDYTAVSSTVPVTVHAQSGRSAEVGDVISNDFSVQIPFVNSDTYSATLDYLATAQ